MSDLISRKALANELQKYFVNNTIHKNDLAEAIAKQPIVEAKPVVHGEWIVFVSPRFRGFDSHGNPIYRDGHTYQCSRCYRRSIIKHNFCPNCGADMRMKVQDEK